MPFLLDSRDPDFFAVPSLRHLATLPLNASSPDGISIVEGLNNAYRVLIEMSQ